jgi:CheY-like chemotaxis protein
MMDNQAGRQTILIVDDQPLNIDVLYGILHPDYRVKVALSGEQALKLAASAPPPDLILLDIMMPGLDGYEVCRRLKANPFTRSIPLIFVTALSEDEDESRGFELGAVDYVTKPVSPPVVQARVRTHLALYDQNRALEEMVHLRTAELQNANTRLRQERARFEWVVKNVDEGYLILDRQGNLRYANPTGRLYLGLPPGEASISGNFIALAQRQYRLHPPEAWEHSLPDNASPRYLVCPESPTAQDFWLKVEIWELSVDAKEKDWVVRLRDVTEEVGAFRDRSAFGKMVQHKLRTPLATIIGGLDMLAQYAPEMPIEELAETSQFALAGARRLQNTVEDILAYLDAPQQARGDAAHFNLTHLPALLTEISVNLTIPEVRLEATGRFKASTAEFPPPLSLTISGRAFELILWELFENARKFHPTHTPGVTIRLGEIQNGQLCLQVGDDGLNLSPEQLEKIWQPFYQAEKFFTGEIPGTGLGLAMVASLVWGAGGNCQAYNQENGPGLVIELRLPVDG